MRRLTGIWLLAFATFVSAQEGEDAASQPDRVRKVEEQLQQEREARKQLEKRVGDLESSLQKATEVLARAQDRRDIDEELEAYFKEQQVVVPAEEALWRLQIGVVLVGSYTATFGGAGDRNTFSLDDAYVKFSYAFTDQLTGRYYTDGSLAELEFRHSDALQLNGGVVVVPFGQFNQRSFPDSFDTLSRPLLYLSNREIFVTAPNLPSPVFNTVYSDTGLVFSGSLWRGQDQLYYAAYVTNGLLGGNDLGQTSATRDNNNDKQIGGRVAYTNASWLERTRIGFGISAAGGDYDLNDELSYRLYGVDLLVVLGGLGADGEGSVTLRAEYVYAPREILYPDATDPTMNINEASREQGFFVLIEVRLDSKWMLYGAWDELQRSGPLVTNGELDPANLNDVTTTIRRFAIGVAYRITAGILFKVEYAYWEFDLGVPDAQRISTQVVVPF